MKLFIHIGMPALALFFFTSCNAQIPNAKTEVVKIYGNCGMCEKTIEKAAFLKGEAKAEWDQDTKMAQITYDSTKTSADAVLQRIAAAGYDSDKFKAPEGAYNNLHACCQYDRPAETVGATGTVITPDPGSIAVEEEHAAATTAPKPAAMEGMVKKQATTTAAATSNPLAGVYAAYFELKDALVSTNGKAASTQASTLLLAIENVKMGDLSSAQHNVWMQYENKLSTDAKAIQDITNTDKQRTKFVTLSQNLYEVMKVVKPESAVYLDNCPMYNEGKGADWLSQEKGIKNPYYGKQMLTCGNVKAVIE